MFAESNPDSIREEEAADCISAANNGVNVDTGSGLLVAYHDYSKCASARTVKLK